MEIRNLKTFLKAAELNSFTKAAKCFHYSQSTVTAHIDALEKELGVLLFIRNGKRIHLSAAGKHLQDYAYRIVALDEEATAHFSTDTEPEGELRIGIVESICSSLYMRVFSRFMKSYPKVKIKVTILTTVQLTDALEEGQLDLIITLDRPVTDSAFLVLRRKEAPVRFFAAPTHPLEGKKSCLLEDLFSENWLLTEHGCNYRLALEEELAKRQINIHNTLEIGYARTLIRFVSEGLGISLLPEFDLLMDLENERIAVLPVSDFQITMQIQLIVSKKRWISPGIHRFTEMLTDVLEET